jgi:histidinol-phosphate aminotransferase
LQAHARSGHCEDPMKPADLVRPEILALSAYPVADAEGMVKLDAMENPYRLPEHLARELAERLARRRDQSLPESGCAASSRAPHRSDAYPRRLRRRARKWLGRPDPDRFRSRSRGPGR